jgi:hypothetical protein
MENPFLFKAQELPPKIRYEKLFANLLTFPEDSPKRGRPPFSNDSLLRALIYRNLRGLPSLSELAFELKNNPLMAETLGFPAWERPPSVERFSHFLRYIPNEDLQVVRLFLVHQLIEEKVVSGENISMDSCPIEANVRENNLKTSVKTRFDKNHKPPGDPEARLGVKIHYPRPFQRKIAFFWGYRNHILTDATSELPVHERTLPADEDEKRQAVPLLKELTTLFSLSIKYVIGDANYDTEDILSHILDEMKATPIIPRNPRSTQHEDFKIKKNIILCSADLEMHRRGRMTVKGKTYLQYSCPLHYGKNYKGLFLICPAAHPKYFSQKGCNYLMRLTPNVRNRIDYGSRRFKKIYNQRTSVERVFSRLLAITMQRPTVFGLQATKNHCTIAYITVLLVALAAHRLGYDDKIRFVKSFLPNFV